PDLSLALMVMRPGPRRQRSTLFPYTTLFRSVGVRARERLDASDSDRSWHIHVLLLQEALTAHASFPRPHGPEDAHHRPDPTEGRSEEHTSELQSRENLVCRLLREQKNQARHT